MRRTKAAIHVQKCWRAFVERRKYARIRQATICIQAFTRGMFARTQYTTLRRNVKATIIQVFTR